MASAIIKLRRDNDYNYDRVKNTFTPAKGEICLVDTANSGLRVKCGDGYHTYGELEYIDGVIQHGYLSDNTFYSDKAHSSAITANESKLYFDLTSKTFYYYFEKTFTSISSSYARASETTAGIMRLYTTTGQNEDGTMTQKAITNELNEKFEIALNIDEELLIFDNDII